MESAASHARPSLENAGDAQTSTDSGERLPLEQDDSPDSGARLPLEQDDSPTLSVAGIIFSDPRVFNFTSADVQSGRATESEILAEQRFDVGSP